MRFVFSPPADEAAGLLTLPFGVPLEQWEDERLVEIRQRGLSRHVVRFVAEGGELYALKALSASGWPGASTGCCARWRSSTCPRSRSSASSSTAGRTWTRSW